MQISVQSGGLVSNVGPEAGYRMIREAGFTAIDWNIDSSLNRAGMKKLPLENLCIFERPLDEVMAYFADQLTHIRKNGLTITQAHAPFPAYMLERPETLDYSIGLYRRCIELCDAVGCQNLIVHSISFYGSDYTNTPESIKALNYRLYGSLIDVLTKTNVTVCLENLFTSSPKGLLEGACSNPYEAVEYIDTLNEMAGKPCFGLCLDTGHLNLLRKDFRVYVPILGQRIKALHIHDNNGLADQHLLPYTGTVNWNDFCQSLHDIGYAGNLSFETFAQVRPDRLNRELIPLFLRTICGVGEYFRARITEAN
ncbi:MAG: sugar phosphate isomerase/epimerase [Clostridia bacterium]|nr:sugar phosphate isomerase/epimerase [Clostridia bacterium]